MMIDSLSSTDLRLMGRGVMVPPIGQITAQGYDLQFGTNVLGHYYLTVLLMPALLAGAATSPDKTVRVVTTSSSAHHFCSLNFNTFKDSPARTKLGTQMSVSFSTVCSNI